MTNPDSDSELHLAADSECGTGEFCADCASPNCMLRLESICPPRVNSGLGWIILCERAEWTVVDKVSTVRCTEAASCRTSSDVAGFIALSSPMKKSVVSIGIGWRASP